MVDSDWYLVDLNQSGLSSNQSIKIDFLLFQVMFRNINWKYLMAILTSIRMIFPALILFLEIPILRLQTKTVPISFLTLHSFIYELQTN